MNYVSCIDENLLAKTASNPVFSACLRTQSASWIGRNGMMEQWMYHRRCGMPDRPRDETIHKKPHTVMYRV